MTTQREFFSRGRDLKFARATWINSTLEKTVVKTLRQGLSALGIPVFQINAPIPCPRCHRWATGPNTAGIPDLSGWVPSNLLGGSASTGKDGPFRALSAPWARPLLIEVKRPAGGVESAAQRDVIDRAKRGGAIAFFCRSWDECVTNLRAAGVRLPGGL